MLASEDDVRTLERLFYALQNFDRSSNSRYVRDMGPAIMGVGKVITELKSEVKHRAQLQSFKQQGYDVDSYLNKSYSSKEQLNADLIRVIGDLNKVQSIMTEYKAVEHKVPRALRSKFLETARHPDNYSRTTSLWAKIKEGIAHEPKESTRYTQS